MVKLLTKQASINQTLHSCFRIASPLPKVPPCMRVRFLLSVDWTFTMLNEAKENKKQSVLYQTIIIFNVFKGPEYIMVWYLEKFKPWLNRITSRHKLKTWVYLRLRLTRPCVHLRWLAFTLVKIKFACKSKQVFHRLATQPKSAQVEWHPLTYY